MGYRLNREDLAAKSPLSHLERGRQHTFVWRVYNEYRPVMGGQDENSYYLEAVEDSGIKESYEPLLDTPHLFLEFARLDEKKSGSSAWGDWIDKYGLLGLHLEELQPYRGTDFALFPSEYSDRGGPEEKVHAFSVEAFHANWALRLYEAALSRDVEKLEATLQFEKHSEQELQLYRMWQKMAKGIHTDLLVDMAVNTVAALVQEALRAFAYPAPTFGLSRRAGLHPPALQKPESMTASLWPRNLLGAMYLQFYWLITSAATTCKHCGRIISHAQPVPGSEQRKAYKNKEFCDRRCRQNYHYHNRRKHRRNDS